MPSSWSLLVPRFDELAGLSGREDPVEHDRADDEGPDEGLLPEVGDADHRECTVDRDEKDRADRGPQTVPLPPKIATPPMTAAATAWSSIPVPASELTVP
ncbi:hypothetical protein GCM10025864_06330 [Luteimicrobium album]|uniref:Uncharacterized protein n=1 Tax=Luteimicrobium album TaxID=1054550 RepID=A0ABQ6HYV0_9MICO|nr:hypothetical protein GCM10025864_06330 [Luteimicrobium album]